ncbi:hypothetical protein L7F22_055069 [Adiantum nelumboides]|nr:hypothetical protein [Adiantum nelumboides]
MAVMESCRSSPRHSHGARHGPGGHHGHPRHSHGARHRPHHLRPAHMSASGPFMDAPHAGPPLKPHRHPMSSFYRPSNYMAPPPHAVDPQHHNLPLHMINTADHMAAPPPHAPQHLMLAGSLDPAAVHHQASYPTFHIRPNGFQLHRTRHFHHPPAAPAAGGAAYGLERLGNHIHRHRRHKYYPQPPPRLQLMDLITYMRALFMAHLMLRTLMTMGALSKHLVMYHPLRLRRRRDQQLPAYKLPYYGSLRPLL